MLGLLDLSETTKNSPDSRMASCRIVIVVHSVVPDVRENVNVLMTGVKSRKASKKEEGEKKGDFVYVGSYVASRQFGLLYYIYLVL